MVTISEADWPDVTITLGAIDATRSSVDAKGRASVHVALNAHLPAEWHQSWKTVLGTYNNQIGCSVRFAEATGTPAVTVGELSANSGKLFTPSFDSTIWSLKRTRYTRARAGMH